MMSLINGIVSELTMHYFAVEAKIAMKSDSVSATLKLSETTIPYGEFKLTICVMDDGDAIVGIKTAKGCRVFESSKQGLPRFEDIQTILSGEIPDGYELA